MKALSVKQPFAGLIAAGIKTLETRTWYTSYRGPLLICASLRAHSLFQSYDYRTGILKLDNYSAPHRYKIPLPLFEPSGVALCVVDLIDIVRFDRNEEMEKAACCDYYEGAWAWQLANPRLVKQVPVKGKIWLFGVEDSIVEFADETIQEQFKRVVSNLFKNHPEASEPSISISPRLLEAINNMFKKH